VHRLWPLAFLACFSLAATLAGCGGGGAVATGSGRLDVVAAEDFWGDLAAGLGGTRVEVTSIVGNPAADPHDYEPDSEDARTLAEAQLAIVNGIGYDEWAQDLIDANPSPGRTVLSVGDLLGLQAGDNPHQWYSPSSVHRVLARISAEYERADPAHAAYFARRRQLFESRDLAGYSRLIAAIRSRFAGAPVGASESIFEPLARALGLRLLTPTGFIDSVSEGTEASPRDRIEAAAQLDEGKVAVWIYNSQNATPEVQRLNEAAEAAAIPIVPVTETPPQGASFQAWMARQLRDLRAALAEASAR
jgi:zinc/manganese transport system substrate-binding protein